MPLTPKQRKIAQEGYRACMDCGGKLAQMRQMGRPNEAAELRQQATQRIYEEATGIIETYDREQKEKGTGNG